MLRLFAVALFFGAVFATPSFPSVDTRADCPPEGFTAISAAWDLSRLPASGQYAICLTVAQEALLDASAAPLPVFDFVVSHDFKLHDSTLWVDSHIRIVTSYPARLMWENVFVDQILTDPAERGWAGILAQGAPTDLPYPGHLSSKSRYGDCGSFENVRVSGTLDVITASTSGVALAFVNCSGKTNLDRISIAHDYGTRGDGHEYGVYVQDSQGLIFKELSVALSASDSGDGVLVTNSQVAFVGPLVFVTDVQFGDAFEITGGSNVTICDGFLFADVSIQLGAGGGGVNNLVPVDTASTVYVAGLSNAGAAQFFNSGGVIIGLARCPTVFSSNYNTALWTSINGG